MAADEAPRAEAPAPVQISRLMDGYLARQLLYVAAKPGLADDLAGAPQTADKLAPGVGAKPGALCRVRRGLSAEGVLAEHPAWRFSRTALETCLRNDMRLGTILRPVPRLQRVLLDQPPVVARARYDWRRPGWRGAARASPPIPSRGCHWAGMPLSPVRSRPE